MGASLYSIASVTRLDKWPPLSAGRMQSHPRGVAADTAAMGNAHQRAVGQMQTRAVLCLPLCWTCTVVGDYMVGRRMLALALWYTQGAIGLVHAGWNEVCK